jgi:hypothetical protein
MVVTQMGIATISSDGRTIHAEFKFNLNHKPKNVQPLTKEVEIFAGLCLLIIEEASTCVQSLLGSIDSHL